ncbi:hypothetical protein IV203_032585 [Nitzschia inconspicua]|uniref:Transmembrane protein n=1 Tax=Nitzschia inconspicua TaxID=303405 RepID=A0A9K3KKZ8_9STRA|nr:hypothetical protein IV203_032585 [Nitzschia inconspicua]
MNLRLYSHDNLAISTTTATEDSCCNIDGSMASSHDDHSNDKRHLSSEFTSSTPEVLTLLHGIHDYHVTFHQRTNMMLYMIIITTYIGVVLTLLVANNQSQDYIEKHYFLPFHFFEFFGALVFAITEAFLILGGLGQASGNQGERMNQLAVLLTIFNVITSAVACILFTLCPQLFEVPSHYIEYSSQVTITLVDYIFLVQLSGRWRSGKNDNIAPSWKKSSMSILLMSSLLIMSILKLFVYSELIPTSMGGERSSHYIEFTGELLNCILAFRFAAMQYCSMNQRLGRRQQQISPFPKLDLAQGRNEGVVLQYPLNEIHYGSINTSSTLEETSPLLTV